MAAFAEVVKAAIWPVVTVVALILFRKPISDFLTGISARASKIGAFNISIELASLPEAHRFSGPNLDDLKEEFPSAASDSSGGLFRQIADATQSDYITVDLKNGEAWLTSRLFILATLIPRVRSIQRIVFLDGAASTFLGECSTAAVSHALAKKYPKLEEAYLATLAQITREAGDDVITLIPGLSLLGRIDPIAGSSILSGFLWRVKYQGATPPAGWLNLGTYYENAEWITTASLSKLLGNSLKTTPVQRNPAEDGTAAAQTLLRHDEDYVAVVDMAGRFLRLVDRRKANDQAVRKALAGK